MILSNIACSKVGGFRIGDVYHKELRSSFTRECERVTELLFEG